MTRLSIRFRSKLIWRFIGAILHNVCNLLQRAPHTKTRRILPSHRTTYYPFNIFHPIFDQLRHVPSFLAKNHISFQMTMQVRIQGCDWHGPHAESLIMTIAFGSISVRWYDVLALMTEPKVFGISQLLPGYHHDVFSSLHVVSFAYKAGIGKVVFGMFGEDTIREGSQLWQNQSLETRGQTQRMSSSSVISPWDVTHHNHIQTDSVRTRGQMRGCSIRIIAVLRDLWHVWVLSCKQD
jgi:hypothetical protein